MVSGLFSIPIDPRHTRTGGTDGSFCSAKPLCRFIGGPENRLARYSFEQFATNPQLNPLVLTGPIGSGKSMLAEAILWDWNQRFPQGNAVATTGGDFASNFTLALETDAIEDFRSKYLKADLLLIDDLDQLADKTAAQQTLLQFYDALIRQNRHLVFTTRQALPGLSSISAALASRIWSGLTVPVALPASDTRQAIIEALAAGHDIQLDAEVIELLSDSQSLHSFPLRTVPQMNHALLQLSHTAAVKNVDIDLAFARVFLDGERQDQMPTLRAITSLVGKQFQIKVSDLRSASRQRAVVRARGVAMYLARQLTGKSLEQIGRHFGGRDHTTVLHACRQIETLRQSESTLLLMLENLENQLTT